MPAAASLTSAQAQRDNAAPESEARLRAIVDAALDGIITIDERGTIESFNRAAEVLFGYPASELLGQNVSLLMPSPDRERHDDYIANYRASGQRKIIGIEREVFGRRKDGSSFPIELAVSESQVAGRRIFVGFVRDISARKQTEEALRVSEERWRTIAENSPILICLTDATGNCIYVNQRWCEASGLAREEALGPGWIKAVHKDDRRMVTDRWSQAMQSDGSWSLDYRLQNQSGLVTWIHGITAPLLNAAGAVVGYVGMNFDITKRKLAEDAEREAVEFNKQIIEGTGAGLVVYDREGRYVVWNHQMEKTTGYRAEEVLGKTAVEVFPHLRDQDFEMLLQRALAGEIIEVGDLPYIHPHTGRRVWTTARFAPWRDANNKIVGAIKAVRDVTDRKSLEAEVTSVAEQERGRIIRDLHDSLGQQLGGALFLSSLLQRDLKERGAVETERASQIHAIIEKALADGRDIARGLYPVTPGPDGLMTALQNLADRVTRDCGIKCEFDADSAVLLDDPVVATHLYRIAQEAVNNAFKHGGATRIDIRLSVTMNGVEISVRDDGKGLPPNSTAGIGLGFQTMKQRAQAIGGRLTIQDISSGGGVLVSCVASGVYRSRPEPVAGRKGEERND